MRPTFMGYESSKTAMFASQKALDIVGHNLSNMSSEGYTRQRTDQVAVEAYSYKNRVSVDSMNYNGLGTSVNGVSQVRDQRLDFAFRSIYSETSYYNKSNDMLADIEGVLSEIDIGVEGNGYGLSWGIKQMYSALEDFASNVNVGGDTSIFAESVNNVTTLLNHISRTLSDASKTYKMELQSSVDDANTMLTKVADLNKQISEMLSSNGYTNEHGPNELIDKRNVLLDQLSSFGKLVVSNNTDGSVNVTMNGHLCVEGKNADKINYHENTNGTVTLAWKADGTPADTDYGTLKASTDVLNGRGNNISSGTETTVRGFQYYEDYLDTFAGKLADILNNTLPETMDSNGNILAYKKLVGESDYSNGKINVYTDKYVTAENIAISDDLVQDPSYIIYDKNSSENAYMIELLGKLSINKQTFSNGVETFTGTFQDYVADYVGRLGNDVQYANSRYESCNKYSEQLLKERDGISGVSETEETMNMLTHNKAFQAAAKLMTTMDDLLDVIVNQIGALG